MKSKLIDKILRSELFDEGTYLKQKGMIFTFLNPVSYLEALKHKELFCKMDGIFADGEVLVKAIEMLYLRTVTRRSFDMTSIAPQLFEYALVNNKTIYIVASAQDEVERAVQIFTKRYKGINIIGYRNGYFTNEEEKDVEARHIVELRPDFLLVGMGCVKQEEFLLKVKETGFGGIGFTCGGFIHQTACGDADYYPKWVDKYNLRFAYRMYKEPHTRKRYLRAGILFPFYFIMEKSGLQFVQRP